MCNDDKQFMSFISSYIVHWGILVLYILYIYVLYILYIKLEYDMDQLFSKQKLIHRHHYIVTNSLVRYFIDSLPHSFHTNIYTNQITCIKAIN